MTDARDLRRPERVAKPRRAKRTTRLGGRPELWVAVVAGVLGASLAAAAGSMTWLTVRISIIEGVAPVTVVLSGSAVQPGSAVLAAAALAAGAGVVATRRWGRLLPGLALLAVGLWVAVGALSVLADPPGTAADAEAVRQAGTQRLVILAVETNAAPVLAVVGGLLMAAAGLLVVVRGWRWGALGERYQLPPAGTARPAGRAAADPVPADPVPAEVGDAGGSDGTGASPEGDGASGAGGVHAGAGARPAKVAAVGPDAWRAIEEGEDPTEER
jgi:uncharacterized membrane protein (TIGR02234 family)